MAEKLVITGEIVDKAHGITEPRIYTKPLRELTPETSRGFEVILFAKIVLGVTLYPWQQWLLIHALELNEDGSYRFRQVIVLVARQNGKSTLMGVLSAWWLYVDAERNPDRISPSRFLIIGAAQTLDAAKNQYNVVKQWANPKPDDAAGADLAIPDLQELTYRIVSVNGEEGIISKSRAQYMVRAANNIRSKSAARVVFDELREQHNGDGWNSVYHTTKAVWSSQLWGISNAGDYRSVVLKQQVDKGRKLADQLADGTDGVDTSFGYFEWSAPDGCALDDVDAVRHANPSVGYGAMSVQSIINEVDGMTESAYRTETLCQWVTADVKPYINPKLWQACEDSESTIPVDGRIVVGVDTSADRETTYVAVAGYREDGLPHVELITRRDGMLWVPKYLEQLRDNWGISEVAVQAKGCPAVDFADPLAEAGFTIHLIEGFKLGACAGRFRDRVRERKLRHLNQPAVTQQIQVAVTRNLGEVEVWDRKNSALQISGLIAMSEALYALETETGIPVEKHVITTGIQYTGW